MIFKTIKNFLVQAVEKNKFFNKFNKSKDYIDVKSNESLPMIKRLKK